MFIKQLWNFTKDASKQCLRLSIYIYIFFLHDTLNFKHFKGRRNGKQPNEKMQEVLKKTIEDVRAMTSKVIAIYYNCIFFSDNSRLIKFHLLFCTVTEISATREVGYTKDSTRSSGPVKRRSNDRLSDGTSAARHDT